MAFPLRIAHRGASGYAPENTLPAFERSLEIGVDLVEVDVRATADGGLMLLHDADVGRTTGRSGPLRELSLEQASRLDAGAWFDPAFAGERIPTLQQALEQMRNRALLLIEMKEAGLEGPLLDLLRCTDSLDHVVVQSFDFATIRELKRGEPRLSCGLLIAPHTVPSGFRLTPEGIAEAVLTHGGNFAALHGRMLTPQLVAGLNKRGLPVWTWTLDDPAHIRQAMEMGVAGIISNFPDRIPRAIP